MQGRRRFTTQEIEELRRLIREKQTADRDRQKVLRARMRRMGFYISDHSAYPDGFVVSDLDELISRGVIEIIDSGEEDGDAGDQSASLLHGTSSETASAGRAEELRHPAVNEASLGDVEAYARNALDALAQDRAKSIREAAGAIPPRPGLYAIHGAAESWLELGLGEPPDDRPLYVGKAERSLVARDLTTHFGNGRTGSSTVRRTFAALLRGILGLDAQPRNPARPERFANYGLSAEDDRELTAWMQKHLALAVWPKPEDCSAPLAAIEADVLVAFRPPLNLAGVATPWTARVKAARAVLAKQAQTWADTNR
jgi:hypothetical protein